MSGADWVGSVGVGLLLLAFVLNLRGVLARDRAVYQALNAVGAGLACWAAVMIDFFPFVLLEGTWSLAALAALVGGGRRLGPG